MIILNIDVEKKKSYTREIKATGPLEAAVAIHMELETWRLDPLSPQVPVVIGHGPFVGGVYTESID